MNYQFNRLLYFTAQFFRKEAVYKAYKDLNSTTHATFSELQQLQQKRILLLLKYAVLHVPYYQNSFAAFRDEILNARLDDAFGLMNKLPVLTKQQAIANFKELQSPQNLKTHANVSSGTTGEPFQFPCDNESWAYRHASIMRFLELHGVRFGDSYGYFTGQHWRNELQLKTKIKDYFFNRTRLSAFSITEQSVKEAYHWLLVNKATYLFGYPSTIADFAKMCTQVLDLDLNKLSLKFIMATGETLTDNQRDYIKEKFACTVGNYYGSVEGGAGAFSGLEGHMHENMETTHVFVNSEGRIFQTDLFLRKMPLIKFDMGDYCEIPSQEIIAKPAHRVVGKIIGRSGEKIKLPNGEFIHPMLLNYFFDLFTEEQNIRRFRFLFGKDKIVLLLEPLKDDIPKKFLLAMNLELDKIFKGNKVIMEFVTELPTLSNGKHRDWSYTEK